MNQFPIHPPEPDFTDEEWDSARDHLAAEKLNTDLIFEALTEGQGSTELADAIATQVCESLQGGNPDECDIGKRVIDVCIEYARDIAEKDGGIGRLIRDDRAGAAADHYYDLERQP